MPHTLTISQLIEKLTQGEFSSREATQSCLDRIDAVDGQLNAMATVDHDIKGSISMGAEMEAAGRFGVDWQKGAGWQKISDASWNATYWEPEWDFGLDDDGATASAAPSIPPPTAYTAMCARVCVSRWRTLSDPGC